MDTPGIHTPEHIRGWREVADAVHAGGGSLFIQLMHAGRMAHPDNTPHTFDTLQEQGELSSPLSTADLTDAYLALWDGLQMHWLYERSLVDTSGVLRRFLESVVPSLKAGVVV